MAADSRKALIAGISDIGFKQLQDILANYNIEAVNVPPEKFNFPLEAIIQERSYLGVMPYKGPALAESLCILHGLQGTQIDNVLAAFAKNDVRPHLMAVTTDTNIKWSVLQLYTQLCLERDNIRARHKN